MCLSTPVPAQPFVTVLQCIQGAVFVGRMAKEPSVENSASVWGSRAADNFQPNAERWRGPRSSVPSRPLGRRDAGLTSAGSRRLLRLETVQADRGNFPKQSVELGDHCPHGESPLDDLLAGQRPPFPLNGVDGDAVQKRGEPSDVALLEDPSPAGGLDHPWDLARAGADH